MNIKNISSIVAVVVLASSTTISPMTTSTAYAGCNSGLGRLDPTCPGRILGRPREDSGSCTQAIVTLPPYRFRIKNETSNLVYYSINGQKFSLSSRYYRDHSYSGGGGTDGCNVERYPAPTIRFDNSYQSGYQETTYRVGAGGQTDYKFVPRENGLDLVRS